LPKLTFQDRIVAQSVNNGPKITSANPNLGFILVNKNGRAEEKRVPKAFILRRRVRGHKLRSSLEHIYFANDADCLVVRKQKCPKCGSGVA